jgi:hypothetical protein
MLCPIVFINILTVAIAKSTHHFPLMIPVSLNQLISS